MSEENKEVETTPVEEPVAQDFEREVSSLKNKNSELLGDLAKLKQFKKSIEELGGIDQFRDMVTTNKQAKIKEVEDSGDIAAIKRQYQDEVTTLQGQLKELKRERLNNQVEDRLRQVVQDAGGTWEFVAPAMKQHVHAEMGDEGLVMEVLDDTGHVWIKDGKDATLEDLVVKLRGDNVYSKAFDTKIPVKTGSGATNSRRRPEVNPWMGEHINLDAQTKIWLDNPDKARRMMQEAGVQIVYR